MKDIAWRSIDRQELADLLKNSPTVIAKAVRETTVYRLQHENREILVIAAPGGAAIVIERPPRQPRRRRQVGHVVSRASR
ncbi:MAG: hypothetical protein HZC24_15005 [Rhodocyclales bacterium]|nr:hypothetical protein [Rhodocyclales bacterium]